MADFTRRTITTVRQEFVVPVGPYGAPSAEIGKAWAVAEREYRAAYGLAKEDPVADNAIVFRPGDDEIVISFETEAPS
ncbi:hypothetical protein PV755_46430 [Streptomyces caniscabiei]|uniref:hypothetical protein n=1 Tax=Streptomyces caniscabiei TaxID=2746961 RepID=UPI0029A38192|nr:hypothetical protein [Streptomyces caniscabiei]MDX3516242.1 hypothetical protein [Streptomyces caniscabiei]